MHKFIVIPLSALLILAAAGCATDGQRVGDTPVGSVLTGDSQSPNDYLRRVEDSNRAQGSKDWVPPTHREY